MNIHTLLAFNIRMMMLDDKTTFLPSFILTVNFNLFWNVHCQGVAPTLATALLAINEEFLWTYVN